MAGRFGDVDHDVVVEHLGAEELAHEASSGRDEEDAGDRRVEHGRDARDSARASAPLKPAEDALLLDTSGMSVDQAVARAIALIEARQ